MIDLDELERLAREEIAAEATIDSFVGEIPSPEWGAALAAEAEAFGDLAGALDGHSVLALIARVRAAEAEAERAREDGFAAGWEKCRATVATHLKHAPHGVR